MHLRFSKLLSCPLPFLIALIIHFGKFVVFYAGLLLCQAQVDVLFILVRVKVNDIAIFFIEFKIFREL